MHAVGVWPHLTVVSVLDIMLVALIIYEFLAQIRGTRAALILVGASVAALVFYFSRVLGLTTLNWLIARFVPYAAFIVIVIFAPEIREALARLGRRLTLASSAGAEAEAYDDIVMAANLFSQNQTGALIVIEREIGLRTYVESGVSLEAHLSYDLLATIFRPSAPLHDGAPKKPTLSPSSFPKKLAASAWQWLEPSNAILQSSGSATAWVNSCAATCLPRPCPRQSRMDEEWMSPKPKCRWDPRTRTRNPEVNDDCARFHPPLRGAQPWVENPFSAAGHRSVVCNFHREVALSVTMVLLLIG